jgi:predicted nucleotidyltransferase
MTNYTIIQTAKEIINEHYPNCSIALLGGSAARKDHTKTSDLDIIILNEDGTDYRESFHAKGWPVEVFVHSLNTYSLYLELERQYGVPLYTRIFAEGIILKDNGSATEIIQLAAEILKAGPEPWPQDKIITNRYIITDILEDLRGSKDEYEDLFIVNTLVQVLHEFILRINQKWIGEGKWVIRSLRQYDRSLADTLCQAMNSFYKDGNKQPILSFSENILANYGGELFEGYKSSHIL